MFVLLANRSSNRANVTVDRLATELRGGEGALRTWHDDKGKASAASLAPNFLPEDAFDRQPIVDQRGVFLCQARVDNRDEVLRQLGLDPDGLLADSAVLAAAYWRWGEACSQWVVGDFAFVAWHREGGRVVAAVDHLGQRRLYWARTSRGIAVSGQLRPLLRHPDVSTEPDLAAIAHLFEPGIDRRATPFTSVRALPGGSLLSWRGDEVTVNRWWNPDTNASVWYRDQQEYVDEVRGLLSSAVAARLRSSTPVSTTLSGGLDSGCVTALASALLPIGGRLSSYTSVPERGLACSQRPGWAADDGPYAAAVAATLDNVDHRLVAPGGRCTLDVLPPICERSYTPVKAASNLLWTDRISRTAATAGSRTLLTGQRGNLAFSWRGARGIGEMVRAARLRPAIAQLAAEVRGNRGEVSKRLVRRARGLGREPQVVARGAPGLGLIRPAWRQHSPDNEYLERPGTRRFWAVAATTPANVWWPDPVAQWGVEHRDPTGDRRLMERLLNYPLGAFRLGARDRGLARTVAQGLLPDHVRLRRTQGAQVPEAPSLIAAYASRYRSALDEMRGSPRCAELFDLDTVGRWLDGFVAGELDLYLAIAFDRAFSVGQFLVDLERRC